MIDGSGVLADPAGIDREELIRLARLRVPVGNFNTSKLSKDGYLVKVEDQDKQACRNIGDIFSDNNISRFGISSFCPFNGVRSRKMLFSFTFMKDNSGNVNP